jgi:hypothetical protein
MCLPQYNWGKIKGSTQVIVIDASQHQYMGGPLPVAPLGEQKLTTQDHLYDLADFLMFAALVHWCKMVSSTNVLVNYLEK